MDAYIDIRVKAADEQPAPVILSSVFSRLHLELVEREESNVGVSFPAADLSIGDQMRLHGQRDNLAQLAASLARFNDYCHISDPTVVPTDHQWRQISRVQSPTTAAKIRRLLKRGSITEAEAENRLSQLTTLKHPFLNIRSHSTGQRFRIFFEQKKALAPTEPQQFNTFGLGGIVPWF